MIKLPIENRKDFVFGGNALFTVKNEKSGSRFTYKIRQKKDSPFFVSVLNGTDNYSNYNYMGLIWPDTMTYIHGKKSKIGKDAQASKVFTWLFPRLLNDQLPDIVNIYHEGKCGRCGRRLTVPESIEFGLGPVCRGHK